MTPREQMDFHAHLRQIEDASWAEWERRLARSRCDTPVLVKAHLVRHVERLTMWQRVWRWFRRLG